MQKVTTVALSLPDKNLIKDECVLRTYKFATSNFEMSAEKEDVMEWVHLEPVHQIECNRTKRNVECKNNSIQRKKKKVIQMQR